MSTLGCRCGYTIRDDADDFSYKGRVRKDQDADFFYERVTRKLALLVSATNAEQREDWISRNFLPGYPRDVDDEGMISDLLSGFEERFLVNLYECENCGRLWLQQEPRSTKYVSYSSESRKPRRLLGSRRYASARAEQGQMVAVTSVEMGSIIRDVVRRVRPYLERTPISGVVLEIMEDRVHAEDDWFYIPVRLNMKEPRTSKYYDMLAGIENEIAQQERLRVMLVPAG